VRRVDAAENGSQAVDQAHKNLRSRTRTPLRSLHADFLRRCILQRAGAVLFITAQLVYITTDVESINVR
jgi:hypothetical protein